MSTESKSFQLNNTTFWKGVGISVLITIITCFVCEITDHHLSKSESISLFTLFIVLVALFFSSKAFIQTDEKHRQIMELEERKLALDEKIRKENINTRKLKYSFEVTEQWHKPEFAEFVAISKTFLTGWEASGGKKKSPEEFEIELDKDPNNRKALIAILNYFEHVTVLIDEDFVDERAVRKTFNHLFCVYLSRTEKFIKHLQDKENDKSIFCHYLEYSEKWSRQRM